MMTATTIKGISGCDRSGKYMVRRQEMDNSDSARSMAAMTEMFMSGDFEFDASTSNALARLYDYVAHGAELLLADVERWSACGIFDAAEGRVVCMPGPWTTPCRGYRWA